MDFKIYIYGNFERLWISSYYYKFSSKLDFTITIIGVRKDFCKPNHGYVIERDLIKQKHFAIIIITIIVDLNNFIYLFLWLQFEEIYKFSVCFYGIPNY